MTLHHGYKDKTRIYKLLHDRITIAQQIHTAPPKTSQQDAAGNINGKPMERTNAGITRLNAPIPY